MTSRRISETSFDRALRAIVETSKSDVLKAERLEKQKRERQASNRKGKRK